MSDIDGFPAAPQSDLGHPQIGIDSQGTENRHVRSEKCSIGLDQLDAEKASHMMLEEADWI